MHSDIFEFSNVYVSMVYVKGEEKLQSYFKMFR